MKFCTMYNIKSYFRPEFHAKTLKNESYLKNTKEEVFFTHPLPEHVRDSTGYSGNQVGPKHYDCH